MVQTRPRVLKTQLPYSVLCYSYKNIGEVIVLKITMEMSKGAYEIAKKVYSEQLTRNEGKNEINRTTGMSEGSAQAFITIFLAMMIDRGACHFLIFVEQRDRVPGTIQRIGNNF
jgi:hypothetical protein